MEALQQPVEASWISEPQDFVLTKASIGFIGKARDVAIQERQLQESLLPIERQFNLTIDAGGYAKVDIREVDFSGVTLLTGRAMWNEIVDAKAPTSHVHLDDRAVRQARRVAVLIQNDPSPVSRAQHSRSLPATPNPRDPGR